MNSAEKIVMECVIKTKASTILQFIDELRGNLHVTFEEGTWAAWLYDLLKPHVTEVVVCNPRKNALLKDGSKSDRIDARKLAEQPYMFGTPPDTGFGDLAEPFRTVTWCIDFTAGARKAPTAIQRLESIHDRVTSLVMVR